MEVKEVHGTFASRYILKRFKQTTNVFWSIWKPRRGHLKKQNNKNSKTPKKNSSP
jgi:hypothetical protein